MKPIGVIIWTEKLENLLGFYKLIFNSKVSKKKDTSAYFIRDNFKFYIAEHSEVSGNSKDPNRIIFNLETDDIELEYNRLSNAGVTFLRSPEIEKWGGKVATFEDPEKNRVNLIEQPK
ncbi:MAG: hypothetical protein CL907_03185 [Dehalococcoidia bacterium]|nr:hypothetical protein [Dehalococcoidia bacterium]MEC7921363.1 VOC family protein [Chloroflexota bacterium]MQG04756.1 hypothetical protein [SAR202 cluster bacterium]|tara:strand:- start:136 stop:489 length:354 start_codon:yes stop_codon:yes gene_type:complete